MAETNSGWSVWLKGVRIGTHRSATKKEAQERVLLLSAYGDAAVIDHGTGAKWVRRGRTWVKTRDRWPARKTGE